jgi:hypothetical protein
MLAQSEELMGSVNSAAVSCVLDAKNGDRVTISAQSVMWTFMVIPPEVNGGLQLRQAMARCRGDGEVGTGMMERWTLAIASTLAR